MLKSKSSNSDKRNSSNNKVDVKKSSPNNEDHNTGNISSKGEKNDTLRNSALKLKKQAMMLFIAAAIFVLLGAGLFVVAIGSNSDGEVAIETAQEVRDGASDKVTLKSKLGFSMTYNHVLDDGQATTAEEYRTIKEPLPDEGPVEWVERDYDFVSIRPDSRLVDNSTLASSDYEADRSNMYMTLARSKNFVDHIQGLANESGQTLMDQLLEQFSPKSADVEGYSNIVELVSREDVVIGDNSYRLGTYKHSVTYESVISGETDTYEYLEKKYVTIQNGLVYTVTVDHLERGITEESEARYLAYIESIIFSEPDDSFLFSGLEDDDSVVAVLGDVTDRSALDFLASLTFNLSGVAFAQEEKTDISDVVAINEPVSVRILAGYCASFTFNSLEQGGGSGTVPLSCTGGQGTGFVLSNDGYVATNGHVADLSPQKLLIDGVASGDPGIIGAILKASVPSASAQEINAGIAWVRGSQPVRARLIQFVQFSADLYSVSNVNESKSYKVQLGHEPAKFVTTLVGVSDANGLFQPSPEGVLNATFVASDYNAGDPFDRGATEPVYTASDVAIIKMEGDNFPVAKLGSIDTLDNGANIVVIGYPGLIETSGLTSTEEILPTATRGIVSNIRDDSGGSHKLIQTDATIDQGNSGGPAFNEAGEVIGIATYGVTSAIAGGEFNYLRDIDDLKKLLESESITLNTDSEVQSAWEGALDEYANRYFTDAIKGFEKTLELYPYHPTAQDFIDRSKARQENGEEARKISALFLPIALGFTTVGLGGGGTAVALHNKHRKHLVASGYAPPQMVQRMQPVAGQQQYVQPQPSQPIQPQPQQPQSVQVPPPGQPVPQHQQPIAPAASPQPSQPIQPQPQPPTSQATPYTAQDNDQIDKN